MNAHVRGAPAVTFREVEHLSKTHFSDPTTSFYGEDGVFSFRFPFLLVMYECLRLPPLVAHTTPHIGTLRDEYLLHLSARAREGKETGATGGTFQFIPIIFI